MTEQLAQQTVNNNTRGLNEAQKAHLVFIMVLDNLCLWDAMTLEKNEINRLAFEVA